MDLARLLLLLLLLLLPLLCLTASAAARTMASSIGRGLDFADYCEVEKTGEKATALCGAATLVTKVSRFSAIHNKRIEECCMAGVPCLCSVAAEPQLAAAGLTVTGILALYGLAPGASCTSKAVPLLMISYVLRDPNVQGCKELVVYVDLVGVGGVPCLSRAAVEFVTIIAGLKSTDLLLAIYNACGGLRLGGAHHKVAVAPYEWYRLPRQQHLYRGCGKGSLGRGISCCEVEETGDQATAMCGTASLATRLSRFCVLDTVVPTVVGPSGRPPCLLAVEPQLTGTGTAILELYTGTDECKDWHLKAPVLLARQGATTTEAPTVAASASASCTTRRLTLLVVPHVLRDRTVQSCKDLVVASIHLGGGVHNDKAVAASCESMAGKKGNLVTRFRSYWSFVECTGSLLIFAFVVAVVLIAFTSKEERELKWEHAHGLKPLDAKLFHDKMAYEELNQIAQEVKQRAKITSWQESFIWFMRIFSTSEQRSDPNVPIYYVSRNYDISYSAFHSPPRKEHTRFMIMSIIVLGVLAVHPVKAAPESLNVHLYFGKTEGYNEWSDAVHTEGISHSKWEFRRHGHKLTLLVEQAFPNEPIAWINTTVHDGDEWARFLQPIDNLYVVLFENSIARHSLQEYTHWFPEAIDLGFDGSYQGINGDRKNLTKINFNMVSSRSDLRILSRYRHGVDDPFAMKLAFTRYVVIFGEGQRFTEVDQCIRDGWYGDCYLQRPDELFVRFDILSCGALEDWKPKSTEEYPLTKEQLKRRRYKYNSTLRKLGINKEEAPGLLRVMINSTACAHNMQDLFPI